jgi:Peptidase M50B-like
MSSPSLTVLISRIGETQPDLSAQNALLIGLFALVVVALPWYRIAEPFDTMAHEGAHALAAWAIGWPVVDMELESNGNGGTNVIPGAGRAGAVLVGVVGYLGPSAGGLLAAWLISKGHSVAVLWLVLVLLGLLLLQVSSFFAVCVVIAAGFACYLAIRYAAIGKETVLAYSIAWFLLLSGVRTILRHGVAATDAGILRGITHVPVLVWHALWLVGSGYALVIGAKLLI